MKYSTIKKSLCLLIILMHAHNSIAFAGQDNADTLRGMATARSKNMVLFAGDDVKRHDLIQQLGEEAQILALYAHNAGIDNNQDGFIITMQLISIMRIAEIITTPGLFPDAEKASLATRILFGRLSSISEECDDIRNAAYNAFVQIANSMQHGEPRWKLRKILTSFADEATLKPNKETDGMLLQIAGNWNVFATLMQGRLNERAYVYASYIASQPSTISNGMARWRLQSLTSRGMLDLVKTGTGRLVTDINYKLSSRGLYRMLELLADEIKKNPLSIKARPFMAQMGELVKVECAIAFQA